MYISDINQTSIDNIKEVRIKYINYANYCYQKLRLEVHKHDLTRFPNIYFNKKKAKQNFCSFRFKLSIHKVFNQHNLSLKIFHLEFYFIFQYYLYPCFQKVTQVSLQVARVFVPQIFLIQLYQQLYQHSKQNHCCRSEWLLLYLFFSIK